MTGDAAARRRRSAAIALVAGFVAFVTIGAVGLGQSGDGVPAAEPAPADASEHAPLGEGVDAIRLVENLGDRCPGAREAGSPAELQALVKATVVAPSVGRIAAAWACGENGVLWFDNGVQVSFETGWGTVDGPAKWADRVKDDGGRTETIGGLTAYVAAAEGEATRNVVEMVDGDTLIALVSDKDVPVASVVEMARSMDLG